MDNNNNNTIAPEALGKKHNYQDIDENEYGRPIISVRNLSKTFNTFSIFNESTKVRAVRNISLDIYSGEIFCLLGHNGAGKTTTIHMLSGLLSASSGNAYINDYSINNNMNKIRKFIGVCPQHDVLWDLLTAEEHLHFFAKLKGVKKKHIQYEVNRIINLFNMLDSGLWGKYPPNMSGGEKRRLSLAIALIGNSRVIFLDEPTSGMDPENRRKVWDIIQTEKKNKCIILTTHYMNEADILGDRIAIMADGIIKCCGSSLYLKRLYGVGYTFTVSLNKSDNDDKIKPLIDQILSDIDGVQTISMAASEIMYRLPFKSSSQFSNIFIKLDNNKNDLDIKTFGISVTTLEEVFIKIGNDNNIASNESMIQYNDDEKQSIPNYSLSDNNDLRNKQLKFEFSKINTFKLDDRNFFIIFLIHIYAILYKRFWWSLRDVKGIICQIILPVVLCGLLFGLTDTILISQRELELNSNQWIPDYTDNIIVPLSKISNDQIAEVSNLFYTETTPETWSDFYQTEYGNNKSYFIGENITFSCIWNGNCSKFFQTELYNGNNNDDIIPYNGFYFVPTINEVLLGVNASAYHSLPITLNIWNNWVLKKVFNEDESSEINVYSYPFPITRQQESDATSDEGIGTAINLMIAFALIPASSIYFVVNEKTIGTKHQQFVSGISTASYWVGTYLSDILLGLPASLLVLAAVYIFDFKSFKDDAVLPFFTTLMLFVSSSIAAGYLLHFFFKSAGKAQFITIIFNILLGVIMLVITFSLDSIGNSSATNTSNDFKSVFSIFPVFLLGDNILLIVTKPFQNPDKSYFNILETNLIYMLLESIGYFMLTLVIEYLGSFPSLLAKLGFVVDQPRKFFRLDDDVLAEQQRIKSLINIDGTLKAIKNINNNDNHDTVILHGLRKVYKGENKFSPYKPAVRDMYFGVPQGQVFGFLGVNGAGKTSTLQLLTGLLYPSSGFGFIGGLSLNNQLSIRRIIGFCPQNDALFDLLTGHEHLKFYALLKGLWNGKELRKQISILLSALTLNKYSSRISTTYSGGNKRKLCVAQAMIGNPPVVFLDEPSTGMDPVSRRHMWSFINSTMRGRCVILTTHSMEECEALCNRVAIMVNGQLSCIGSPQHLKSKYGKGYQLNITLKESVNINDNINKLLEELNNIFPTTIIEQNGNKLLLEIKQYQQIQQQSCLSDLGKMFEIIENIKIKYNILTYALSQTSLEQVFLKMAKNKGVTTNSNNDITKQQKNLLNQIQSETKNELLKRIEVLNRDHLQQILQNEIRNGSQYIVKALDINQKDIQQNL